MTMVHVWHVHAANIAIIIKSLAMHSLNDLRIVDKVPTKYSGGVKVRRRQLSP